MLGNSPRQQTVITLEARKSFAFGLQFKHADSGVAVDLTGATVRLVAAAPKRMGGAAVITKTATDVDLLLGLVQFELQAADLDLVEEEYPFTVTLVSALGYSTPVIKGVFAMQANTDLDDTNVYTGHNPSTQLAAYLDGGGLIEVRVAQLDGMAFQVKGLLTNFSAEVDAKNAAHTLEVEALRDQAAGHQLLAESAADSAASSALDAEAAADRAASVATGATDPTVADLVGNSASATNNAIETLIGQTAPATHNHDDRYYTETEIDAKLQSLPVSGHTHDDRYYTETEIDDMLGEITGGAVVAAAEPALGEGEFWYDTDELEPDMSELAGPVTLGTADTDVIRQRGYVVETHARTVENTYTSGKLTQVVEKSGANVLKTTTLGYTGEQLTTVTEVADGITATTTLTYNGDGTIATTTRTVA